MPQSLILELVPYATLSAPQLSAQHLHRLFLGLVGAVDPPLAQILQADNQNKSYTLSPLQLVTPNPVGVTNLRPLFPEKHPSPANLQYQYNSSVPSGSKCWWRITLLDDILFANLTQAWNQTLLQQSWYIGATKLQITSLSNQTKKYPGWAHSQSYQQLYQQASDTHRHINFQVLTPATFWQGNYESPMPTREAIFHSLRKRWNRYSGLALAPSIITPIVPTAFDLHTKQSIDNDQPSTGCLGKLSFQILGEVDPLTIKRINTLADFTFYCSVGRKTTLGMGIMRRI
jgi:CRISPR-associated endoribonuclease Cas6